MLYVIMANPGHDVSDPTTDASRRTEPKHGPDKYETHLDIRGVESVHDHQDYNGFMMVPFTYKNM